MPVVIAPSWFVGCVASRALGFDDEAAHARMSTEIALSSRVQRSTFDYLFPGMSIVLPPLYDELLAKYPKERDLAPSYRESEFRLVKSDQVQ